ncbi:peptidoglycan-binding protein [Mesorhizobium sp. SB112]|uniref:peptidoglycan-binding domain-containing protein n=1 Tax=Mesorhizobium sp. SB112 TaxID=3151853 RepID=UPI003263F8B9
MARSARQAKKRVQQRPGVLHDGAAALGGFVSRNPVLVGGSTAFLVALFYVSANALWYQPHAHLGAFFATRDFMPVPTVSRVEQELADEPETTFQIERPAEPVEEVRGGDPLIARVQTILKELNFYSDAVDGLSGPGTRRAIAAYQTKMGLKASGEIDAELLDQLGASEKQASAPPTPTLRRDITNAITPPKPVAEVRPEARTAKIQEGLRAFGNEGIEVDGKIGARTTAAIKEFQSLFGLSESGQPDEAVYVKMKEIGLIK